MDFWTVRVVTEYRFCPKCGANLEQRLLKEGEPERLVCTDCGFVFYLDPKVAAGVLFRYQGRIVLLRRALEPRRGKWVFPGGYVDRGEPVETAARREVLEESGVEVETRGLLGVYSIENWPVVIIVYEGEYVRGQPVAGDESLELGLFDPSEIPWDELGFPTTRMALRDYLRRLGFALAPDVQADEAAGK